MSAVRKVGILGGMGPAAGVDFVRLFLAACEAHLHARGQAVRDQAYPEHWMVQVPAPDRTAALLEGGLSPFPSKARALQGLLHEGVATVAIACNTAHEWRADCKLTAPIYELEYLPSRNWRSFADNFDPQRPTKILEPRRGEHELRVADLGAAARQALADNSARSDRIGHGVARDENRPESEVP